MLVTVRGRLKYWHKEQPRDTATASPCGPHNMREQDGQDDCAPPEMTKLNPKDVKRFRFRLYRTGIQVSSALSKALTNMTESTNTSSHISLAGASKAK